MKNMEVVVVRVPRRLTMETSVQFACKLRDLQEAETYVFDFGAVGRIEPFALLFLSSEIQTFASRRSGSRFSATNYESCTYAGHMGFFKSFGLDFGKAAGEARGSGTYIPITIYDTGKIIENAANSHEAVGEFIERDAQEMAEILTRSRSGTLFDTMTYSIREIVRNSIEHSQSYQVGFCAQYWPSYEVVELAILDRGIGIRQSLSSNPHLNIANDHDALNLCLMPGISGKAFKGARRNANDVWANTGYGLYMTSRLCREGGSYFIASGKTGIYLSENKKRYLETPFDGTAIKLTLNTRRLSSLNKMLQKYRKDASEYNSSNNYLLSASKASIMLSKDFK
jgi:hypothetical protein